MDGACNVTKLLDSYYSKRHSMEKGDIRDQLKILLTPIAVGDGDVVDSFSFVVQGLLVSVFNFFGAQVRARVPAKTKPRYKDREDMAKSYYLCGVVILAVRNLVKKKKNADYLAALSHFTIDRDVAVRVCLMNVCTC